MAQWDVYPNPVAKARARIPYIVVLQSELLSDLPTRVVMPLSRSRVRKGALPPRMAAVFELQGERLTLKPHEIGTLPAHLLGSPVASLRDLAHELVGAFDAVISGV